MLAGATLLHARSDEKSPARVAARRIVSLLYVMENGASAEIDVVGNEGIVGISLFMGGESTPSRAVVQSAGQGLRLKAPSIKDEFNRAPVMHLLLRYTQALITQMSQTAVCNLSWSSYFAHADRLLDCRFMLEGIGWQVAQFGVQPRAVVEADDVVGDIAGGLGMVRIVALPDAFHLQD